MMHEEDGWKVEHYHGAKLMVRAQPRAQENQQLSGHGHQWSFEVRIAADGATQDGALQGAPGNAGAAPAGNAGLAAREGNTSTAAHEATQARSDSDVFYSTEVIAEQMGFIKARELVDHRTPHANKPLDGAAHRPQQELGRDKGEHGKTVL